MAAFTATKLSLAYMNGTVPDGRFLYHYTTADVAINHILQPGKLRFSCMRDSRDPLEAENFQFSAAGLASGSRATAESSFNALVFFGWRQNVLIKTEIKFACFSVDATTKPATLHQKGYCRSRMWSQYADGHAGACIAFDRRILVSQVRAALSPEDLILRRRVVYSDDLSSLEKSLFLLPGDGVLSVTERIRKYARLYFFRKLRDYRDESEYRICYLRRERKGRKPELVPVGNSISGIVLGASFSEASLPAVVRLSRMLKVPLFKMSWYLGAPSVEKVGG